MAETGFRAIPAALAVMVGKDYREGQEVTPHLKLTTLLARPELTIFLPMAEKEDEGEREGREVTAVTAQREVTGATALIALALRAARETAEAEGRAVAAAKVVMGQMAGRGAKAEMERILLSTFRLTGREVLSILSGKGMAAQGVSRVCAGSLESPGRVVTRAGRLPRLTVLRPVRLTA
jgi:hypothetical protein